MTPESTESFVENSIMRPTTDSINVARSVNHKHGLSLRNARKLSRVFTELSLLDPFASRKNADRPATSPQSVGPMAHDHIHARRISLAEANSQSHTESPPPSTSPMSKSRTPEIKAVTTPHDSTTVLNSELNSESIEEPLQPSTPSTSQISPPRLPEISPSPSFVRQTSRVTMKQRKSLDLRRTYGSSTLGRSTSLRISDMRRPATHDHWRDSSPDIRELPILPESYNHYLEVKRARKMTQLFGQELPPELIRVPDRERKSEHPRNSSSSLESSHSAQETDDESSLEEDVTDKSSPKLPHENFQKRRRRIVKLTQFFGVSHSEIASSVVNAKPDDRNSPPRNSEAQEYAPKTVVEHGVGVKIVSRRRWGLGEDMRDVELGDAINRLRGLKSV